MTKTAWLVHCFPFYIFSEKRVVTLQIRSVPEHGLITNSPNYNLSYLKVLARKRKPRTNIPLEDHSLV